MAKPGAEECSEEGGGMSAFGFLSFVLAVVNDKLDRKQQEFLIQVFNTNDFLLSFSIYLKIFCQAYQSLAVINTANNINRQLVKEKFTPFLPIIKHLDHISHNKVILL